jgi:selenocysteine-specific elongation factor
VSVAGHVVRLGDDQRRAAENWLRQLDASPFSPPSGHELAPIDGEILQAMVATGDPVCLAEGLYVRASVFAAMRDEALRTIDGEGDVDVARLRDSFQSSRRIALALLEHLDDLHVTRRVGDVRVRGSAAPGDPLRGERH